MTQTDYIIAAQHLVKKFPTAETDLVVLKGVDLVVTKGEFLAIVGRSGSGKSTLLYQLGLLDQPSSGTIYLEGRNTANLSQEARTAIRLNELGYVFQDYALVPELTATENVMMPLLMQGWSQRVARAKAVTILEQVGLGDRLDNVPSKLSGGEQQRVSIARAIGHEPKVLFADEPTANLDNETSLKIMRLFQELHRAGQTIIMVTHEPEYAQLTDRIVTLFDGEITHEELVSKKH